MSGGYGNGKPPTDIADLLLELDAINRRLDTLERPSGEQLAQVVEELTALVNDIQAQLDDYIATGTYNKAQIDNLIANPPGNVNVAGTITANYAGNFPSGLRSTGAYNTLVTGGGAYVAAWIHNDGRIGYAPSSRRFKTDVREAGLTVEEVLKLQAFFFRYFAEPPYGQDYQREHLSIMAEDTHDAGFEFLVDYDEDGKPFGIRADMLAAVVLEGLRALYGKHLDLERRVAAIEGSMHASD